MKITQKLVAEVKRSNRCSWHDQNWHNFQRKPEVEAVKYALRFKNADDTVKDIVENAKKYLSAPIHF
jgi:hypothetical protein